MCGNKPSGSLSNKLNLYSEDKGFAGKFNTAMNPAGAVTHKNTKLDENVDNYTEPPDMPAPPPELQAEKNPDLSSMSDARKKYYKANTGTLLTGPSGVSRAKQAFGNTLLGG